MARLVIAGACLLAGARGASAQQLLNFSIGGFVPRGEDARVINDVLIADENFLTFSVADFNGPIVGGEWLVPLGEFFEVGAGVSFYRRTEPSFYTNFVNTDGSDITQELRLRLIPITATFRVLPFGRHFGLEPYFGAGIAVTNWRYSETGEFIDFSTPAQNTFRGTFEASGNAFGPVALGGVRFGVGSFVAGGEIRYTKAEGDLSSDFAGSKIDLGGWSYLFTAGIRFGSH
jgi:hypothetical protein